MHISNKKALSFDDVLLVPQYFCGTSRREINISTTLAGLDLSVPILSANMNFCGIRFALELSNLGGLPIFPRQKTIKEQCEELSTFRTESDLLVGSSIGIGENCLDHAKEFIDRGTSIICLDVAHADQRRVYEIYAEFRNKFPKFPLIVGNYATPRNISKEMYEDEFTAFKSSVGSGAVCSTRIQTGCGLPTFQSGLLFAERGLPAGGLILDGGIKNSGDCVKSLAVGANAVMLGSLFAGCDESTGGFYRDKTGNKFKSYRGNASAIAKKNAGLKEEFIEGVETLVPSSGPLKKIVKQLEDGIRSGMSYCGAMNLQELYENAEFVEITTSGHHESKPHGTF